MKITEAEALLLAIGARVATLRKRRGLTQERFAEAIGVSPGYLRRLEHGSENLTLRSVGKLARSMGLSIFDLLQRPLRGH